MSEFSYDVVQYDSFPYKQTHPNHLFTIGSLFGLTPKPFKQARILELGCASGGNVIPMACSAPDAKFVGIDLSQKQIEAGQNVVKALNLKNITLEKRSILDVSVADGAFDYILCHGVYSWVDRKTQDKILSICKQNLSEQGIAFISYNALPGWNMVKSIRDMMNYHIQHISDPKEKAQQSRSILQFILNGIKDNKSPYSKFLESEINILSQQQDSYLYHEHLEENNNPIYFYEFAQNAKQHNLDYLADTEIAQMFAGNLPQSVAQEFSKITDIIRLGQYMDFVRNQRFRQTLLCHENVQLNRNICFEKLKQYSFSYAGTVEGDEASLHIDKATLRFKGQYITIAVTDFVGKAVLWILSKQTKPIAYVDFIQKIKKVTKSDIIKIEKTLEHEVNWVRLVIGGMVQLSSGELGYSTRVCQTPKVSSLVKYQLQSQNTVTNQRHELVRLSPIEKELLKLCDGSIKRPHLARALADKLVVNKITLQKEDGHPVTNKEEIYRRSEYLAEELIHKFMENALFVAT